MPRGDPVRLLGRRGGYTSDPRRALPAEPEAVDPAQFEQVAAAARIRDAERERHRPAERARLPLAVRIEQARAQARLKGIHVRPQLRLARLAMEAGRSHEHAARRVGRSSGACSRNCAKRPRAPPG